MDLTRYLREHRALVDDYLDRKLCAGDRYPEEMHAAMRHCLFAGGKRIRPILAIAAAEMLGTPRDLVLPAASALELVHTCSLILDDLPCMDDASIRRGRPTVHLQFGEDVAILAAIGLLNFAYGLVATEPDELPVERRARVVAELSEAIGTFGVIGGQLVDLRSTGREIDFETLEYIHSHKTGALLVCSLRLGGVVAGADEATLAALTRYAKNVGLAFQIADDLLDVEGSVEETGKDVQQDVRKTTFVTLCGVRQAKQLAKELVDSACAVADQWGEAGGLLRALARFAVERRS